MTVTVKGSDGETRTEEFAPHAIEAAALYAVVTRLDEEDLPNGLDLVDKALIYDKGTYRREIRDARKTSSISPTAPTTANTGSR